ncbi:MAG: CBS domain-containing protein [Planctomycetaceae bacterium]|nr:CBS domain-containing protein [Planctomycetaceae bacterium]
MARRVITRLRALLRWLGLGSFSFATKWIGLSALIGLAGGLVAWGFEALTELVRHWSIVEALGIEGEGLGALTPRNLWIVLVPAVGGLLVGGLVQRFAPEARGHGTEQMIRAFHRLGGGVRRRVIALKATCSALTIGSGGSGGLEGPVCQIGSGVGSMLAEAFHLGPKDKRVFLLAGASAGIGALFTAPLGGALFAPEVLYKKPEIEGEAIVPCIVSSIVAYTSYTSLTGRSRVIDLPQETIRSLSFDGPTELAFYLVLAVVLAVVGWLWVRGFESISHLFDKLARWPLALRAGLGGLLTGLLILAIAPLAREHGVMFGGYGLMRASILGELTLSTISLLLIAKIVATSLTIGSGGSGGVFSPTLAIGALGGAGVGQAANYLFPSAGLDPSAFALVGMGGFLAGVAKTPIAAVVIVCEMTGNYALLAPLMMVSVVHLVFARNWSIYDTQVGGVFESPAHEGDVIVDVLAGMRVSEVLDRSAPPQTVPVNATLRKALDLVSKAQGSYFPVVDSEGLMVGIFSLSDVRRIFLETDVHDIVIVRDFMVDRVATVTPNDSLDSALRTLNELSVHEVPVVDTKEPRKVLAMLTRNQVGAAYHQRLREHRQRLAAEGGG